MANMIELMDEMQVLHETAKTIRSRAEVENRDLTEDEATDLNAALDKWDALDSSRATLDRINQQEDFLNSAVGRASAPTDVDGSTQSPRNLAPESSRPKMPATVATDRGSFGFPSIGHWAVACQQSSVNPSQADPRITARNTASTSYSSEGIGADGGYLVPPDFRSEIMSLVADEEGLLSKTLQMATSSNSVTLPVDEGAPWGTSSGLYSTWEGEGSSFSERTVSLKSRNWRCNKLVTLAKVTDELLEDAVAMDKYIRTVVPARIAFEINDKLINGTGAGQLAGILNSGALIEVAKTSGQTADTINFQNIHSMWHRLYAPSRSNSYWLANQDTEQQLMSLAFDFGATNPTLPIYMPSNNVAGAPFSTLMGRPVIFTQACPTLGDPGDIILADLKQYLSVVKGGLAADVSIHLHFDQSISTYRFVLRVGGGPLWSSALTSKNGSSTYSPFVTIATRP